MSTLKVDTIQDTNAVEMYLCKAWVNFNGDDSSDIRGSGNISSVTDIAVGRYEINFLVAFEDTNYACVGTTNLNNSSGGSSNYNRMVVANAATTSKAYFNTFTTSGSLADVDVNQAAFFR